MKIDFLADTNFLVYLHEGNPMIEPFLRYDFGISFISEIELLGFKGISTEEEIHLKALLEDCFILEWNNRIKHQTIELRKKVSYKTTRCHYCSNLDCL